MASLEAAVARKREQLRDLVSWSEAFAPGAPELLCPAWSGILVEVLSFPPNASACREPSQPMSHRGRAHWQAPPRSPVSFVAALREAHNGRRNDPSGLRWPWTADSIVNGMATLDENRPTHAVTAEVLEAAAALDTLGKVQLSIAVRYRQSARGAAARYAGAIKAGCLAEVLAAPLSFAGRAPYRNVIDHTVLAQSIEQVSTELVRELPFATLVTARDWLKVRLVGKDHQGRRRKTSFHAAEVARDLGHLGLVRDVATCEPETGATAGLRLAQRFFPQCGHKWTPGHIQISQESFGRRIRDDYRPRGVAPQKSLKINGKQ